MRSALPSLGLPARYTPRHAAPRDLGSAGKTAAAASLTVALLPLGAIPALADDPAPADSGATATTSDTSTATTGPEVQHTPAPSASKAAAAPSAKRVRATTQLQLSAPAKARAGRVPVSVRLRADSRGVRNGFVRLEKSTGAGWTYAGRLLTNQDGVGAGTLRLARSTRLRAAYSGTNLRTPDVTPAEAVTVSSGNSRAVEIAARFAGRPYVYGATGPSAFDCSGFTRYVFSLLGKSLPHNSGAQARMTQRIAKSQAQPGDLVFLGGGRIGHVGIYAGRGMMWDAPHAGKSVTLRRIYSSDYIVGRVL